jgi:hypothetical protein
MANKKISELANAGALTGAELIEAVQGGVNVKTTAQAIADLGSGASFFRGAYNASGNAYPAAGTGSGTAGAIQAGDEWYVSVSGQITARTGSMIVEVGTILKALTNVPGQTVTNWAVIQVS